jgi:hypothetical protein
MLASAAPKKKRICAAPARRQVRVKALAHGWNGGILGSRKYAGGSLPIQEGRKNWGHIGGLLERCRPFSPQKNVLGLFYLLSWSCSNTAIMRNVFFILLIGVL